LNTAPDGIKFSEKIKYNIKAMTPKQTSKKNVPEAAWIQSRGSGTPPLSPSPIYNSTKKDIGKPSNEQNINEK